MTAKEKVSALRKAMQRNDIAAFIIFSADPHMSEYMPAHWQERAWLSGFTGSAGFVVVTKDKAGLWTDSRYFVQAPMELEGSGIELFKEGVEGTPDYIDWLIEQVPQGGKVGVNALATSHANWEKLEQKLNDKGIQLIHIPLIDEIWENREIQKSEAIFVHPLQYAGESVQEKLNRIKEKMHQKGADTHIVTALDDVAWTTNLRGSDVAFNPVFLGYLCIEADKTTLFVAPEKVTEEVRNHLQQAPVQIKDYDAFLPYLENLKGKNILLAPNANQLIFSTLSADNNIIVAPAPGNLFKAIKNEAELEGFRKVMLRDGISLVKFFYWLKNAAGKEDLNEYSIGEKLREFRAQGEAFVGESFGSIVGYQGNGAVVHYSATKDKAKKVRNEGTILIDSGGQYREGTTDITRTLSLGEPSAEFKKDWTLVLKGMINLSSARFPKGTCGVHLDALARLPLWMNNRDFGHGTGHGVGSFMNVHEGPQNIRKDLNHTQLVPGMVVSNEPGLYRENQYGIRIENLIAVTKHATSEFGEFYNFETLTLCPLFLDCLAEELLTPEERAWINDYHARVEQALAPHLEGAEREFLHHECRAI
ncbi:aminopeptidase P family protein [Ornithobacterium rhinotracheale]|uniref:Aminopeptidase P family protein n=1 Tax=Ornithobacterium rhinotracheale TaxID=28251 RepID=A0A3R6AVU7_ORNRH|nr:aminopeptidase P family protein [Ornithobacterium rhinotracheale]QAR31711.1 aminopeptidase P family protein [Ornithobacterium rhinotracheale]